MTRDLDPNDPNELLTIKQVSAIIRLSVPTIFALRASGDFPQPIRVGRMRVYWRRHEIDAYLASRERVDLQPAAVE